MVSSRSEVSVAVPAAWTSTGCRPVEARSSVEEDMTLLEQLEC